MSGDHQKLHELTLAALDGEANDSELQALTEILRESPEARDEYLKLVDLHAVLATELVPANVTPTQASIAEPSKTTENSSRQWRLIAIGAAALAASLLFAINWFGANDVAENTRTFASIAQQANAVWESDAVAVGDRLGPTTLRLKSGIVRLEFDSDVEVTLKGPAEFKLVDIANAQLTSGSLTANVPPGAEGFTVDTPSVQVIDLGTSFGIDIGGDGFSNVCVFEGEVEISPQDTTKKRLLSEGESVRVGTDYAVEDIVFDGKPFEKMWPTASGIAGSSESMHFVPPWPKQIRFIQSDDQIFVRAEASAVRLKTELNVSISQPSECTKVDDLTPATLQARQSVRSYILHYSPKTQLGSKRAKRISGSITFDRPVLGIIVSRDELVSSSRRFARRGAGEGNQRRELDLTGQPDSDRIALSEDRKTITLDWVSPGRTSDLVRVIVESTGRRQRPRNRNE